jgi:hypothetical protein
MDLLAWLYVALFAAWLVLSAVGQFHSEKVTAMRRFDPLHLLPIWTFFAPNPGRSDYHIISRDRLADGRLTEWTDVLPIPRPRPWSLAWNPTKRRTKVVADAVGSIMDTLAKEKKADSASESSRRGLIVFGPYLLLVHVVLHESPHPEDAVAFQFAVVERFAFGEESAPVPLLRSPFHKLA